MKTIKSLLSGYVANGYGEIRDNNQTIDLSNISENSKYVFLIKNATFIGKNLIDGETAGFRKVNHRRDIYTIECDGFAFYIAVESAYLHWWPYYICVEKNGSDDKSDIINHYDTYFEAMEQLKDCAKSLCEKERVLHWFEKIEDLDHETGLYRLWADEYADDEKYAQSDALVSLADRIDRELRPEFEPGMYVKDCVGMFVPVYIFGKSSFDWDGRTWSVRELD